ncbi:MAG: DUF1476 domain-containing protein [Sneathiellaceae bacterium]
MSTFDEREKGYEAKYVHDEATLFKIMSRRNKLLGLWVAERMGKAGADADSYAREVVMADLDEPGEEDVFRKVRGDLDKSTAHVTDNEIRRQMADLRETARQQVMSETK